MERKLTTTHDKIIAYLEKGFCKVEVKLSHRVQMDIRDNGTIQKNTDLTFPANANLKLPRFNKWLPHDL